MTFCSCSRLCLQAAAALACSSALAAPASPSNGYLDSAFGWQPRLLHLHEEPPALRQLPPAQQQTMRVPGVPTPAEVLAQKRALHEGELPPGTRGSRSLDLGSCLGGWRLFPSAPPRFMPYLDGLFVPGNTCVEPGALLADDALSTGAQAAKAALSRAGLQYTLTLSANYTGITPRPHAQRTDFMAFNNQLTGSWFLAKSADNARGVFLSFEADWGQGANYNERRQSAQQSIGSLCNPQGSNRGGNGVFVPNLALGYSHWNGRWVSLVGTIDMSNFMDQNAYSANWSGNLTNESFNYNPVLPMQWANWGYLTAVQPCKEWYVLYTSSGCDTKVNQNPFRHMNHASWVHMAEVGYVREDSFGLGPGTYRLLFTLSHADHHEGVGGAINVQQQLGHKSRMGFFSRCGIMDSKAASLTGVKMAATAGLVLQAPFRSTGWGSAANNDQVALGFLWERAAPSENPCTHRDELGLELSAVVQVTPTFFLQPDLQYILHPVHETDDSHALVFQLQGVFRF